jgi:hypothetical protein
VKRCSVHLQSISTGVSHVHGAEPHPCSQRLRRSAVPPTGHPKKTGAVRVVLRG